MLAVFAVALTPWNIVHLHKPLPPVVKEVNCKHLSHVEAHADNCLVCHASFEKNFIQTRINTRVFLSCTIFGKVEPILKSFFTEIKTTSLRGPPNYLS